MTSKYQSFIIAAAISLLSASATTIFSPAAMAAPHKVFASARQSTATYAITNMTCAMCPITVKTAMEHVDGVKSVQVNLDAKTATVKFDPSRTTLKTIAAASTNAGYTATIKQ